MLAKCVDIINKRLPHAYRQLQPSKFDNVIVAMSSGVDSSMAAAIYSNFPNARGIYMRNWDSRFNDGDESSVTMRNSLSGMKKEKKNCDEQDWKDAERVANYLNMPIDLVNFEKDYWIDVFEPMLDGYQSGITPNPDVLCNRFIKFGKLVSLLDEKYGRDNYWLVTGHYSRILQNMQEGIGRFDLLRGIDNNKDQSYYLSQIHKSVLPNILLPIGHFKKKEIRDMAHELNIPTAAKPDSQGICFVNNTQHGKFSKFLKEYISPTQGHIITMDDETGKKIKWGHHDGLWSYTIGQKVGIPMPQGDPKYKGSWFVSEKIKDSNELVIVRGGDNPKLYGDIITLTGMKLLIEGGTAELEKVLKISLQKNELFVQYRSLQQPILVESYDISNTESEFTVHIKLLTPQRAIAPGQYGCLYSGERVLGSGTISQV